MPGEAGEKFQIWKMSREAKEPRISGSRLTTSRLRPILAPELREDVPLEKVYVGRLKDRRNTSKAIQSITAASPGFGHLKRCSGFRLLLTRVESPSLEETMGQLAARGFDLTLLEENIEELEVPASASRTKAQAEVCGKLWPVNFHPDPTTESIISGSLFSEDQLSRMETLMRLTIAASRIESVGNSECNGSALIVDPDSGQPLALAASKLDQHPLWHAAMLAIDLIAKHQGGGAWDLVKNAKTDTTRETTSKRKPDPGLPLCYPPSLIVDVDFPATNKPLQESGSKSKSRSEDASGNFTAKTGPYLCTNFWIFLVKEPCALCAMALLHSRASRIFYGVETSSGVLGSKAMLHTTPGLNHRYQVWSGILKNECEAVCEEIKSRELKLS